MRVLIIGDVVGKPGRKAVEAILPGLRKDLGIDLTVINGENAAGGFGITYDIAQELFNNGADVITSGNHIWDQRDIIPNIQVPSDECGGDFFRRASCAGRWWSLQGSAAPPPPAG